MPQLMRTSNPALNDQAFQGQGVAVGDAMTLQGTVNKTGILLICTVATAAWTWNLFLHSPSVETVAPLLFGGTHRRPHFRIRHYLQEDLGTDNRSHLRAARRTRAG